MVPLEWLFRGDVKDSHYSFEIDLSLCFWPPASSVQSCVTVPRILKIWETKIDTFLHFDNILPKWVKIRTTVLC